MPELAPRTTPLRKWFWVTIIWSLCVAGYAAYHRVPWSDEGWFASPAWNLANHASMGTPVLTDHGYGGHLTRIEERTYWVFPGFLLSEALWYKVFPSTIFWTRLHNIAWFALGLTGLFWYLRGLLPQSRVIPWLATLLFAGSFLAIDNAGFARPEIPVCALGLCAMAVYVNLRERSLPQALFFANTLIALSGLMHPNGIFHWIGLMALILWLDRGRIRLASLAAALLPYIVVGGLWGMYLMQDFQAVREQLQVNTTDRWATTLNPVVILGNELGRYWQTYGLVTGGINSIKVLGLALNVMGVVGCLWVRDLRRQPTVRFLLIQLGLYFLGLSLFNQKLSIYLVHIAPFYAILAAVWLEWLAEHRARWRPLIAIAIAGLILIETGGIVLKSYTRSYVAGQRALVSFIRSQARPDDHIAGTASLLFEMQFDSRLKDDPYLGTQSGRVPDIIVVEQLYQMLYDGWKTQRAEDMQPVMARFEDYRVAYQKDGYAVWLRKDR